MSDDTLLKILSLVLGAWGTALSTSNLLVQRREKAKRVKVTIAYGWLTFGDKLSDQHLLVGAANDGPRSIHLTSWRLVLPDGKGVIMPCRGQSSRELPCDLSDGQEIKCWIRLKDLQQELRSEGYGGPRVMVRGEFTDGTGRTFQSKPHRLSLES